MKKVLTGCSIVLALLICAFIVNSFLGSWTNRNVNKYIELTEDINALPKIDELGEYNKLQFKLYKKNKLMFFSDAYILKLSYDETNYYKEKEELSQNYVYETKPVIDDGGYVKEPFFEMETYNFKMLSVGNYGLQTYPHEMIFIGASDEKCEIAVVYYFDFDLDYIDGSFEEFLRDDCGWE